MSESAVGVEVTATRQNAGSDLTNAAVCVEFPRPGMVSAPVAPESPAVIFAWGRGSFASVSQEFRAGEEGCAHAPVAMPGAVSARVGLRRTLLLGRSPMSYVVR